MNQAGQTFQGVSIPGSEGQYFVGNLLAIILKADSEPKKRVEALQVEMKKAGRSLCWMQTLLEMSNPFCFLYMKTLDSLITKPASGKPLDVDSLHHADLKPDQKISAFLKSPASQLVSNKVEYAYADLRFLIEFGNYSKEGDVKTPVIPNDENSGKHKFRLRDIVQFTTDMKELVDFFNDKLLPDSLNTLIRAFLEAYRAETMEMKGGKEVIAQIPNSDILFGVGFSMDKHSTQLHKSLRDMSFDKYRTSLASLIGSKTLTNNLPWPFIDGVLYLASMECPLVEVRRFVQFHESHLQELDIVLLARKNVKEKNPKKADEDSNDYEGRIQQETLKKLVADNSLHTLHNTENALKPSDKGWKDLYEFYKSQIYPLELGFLGERDARGLAEVLQEKERTEREKYRAKRGDMTSVSLEKELESLVDLLLALRTQIFPFRKTYKAYSVGTDPKVFDLIPRRDDVAELVRHTLAWQYNMASNSASLEDQTLLLLDKLIAAYAGAFRLLHEKGSGLEPKRSLQNFQCSFDKNKLEFTVTVSKEATPADLPDCHCAAYDLVQASNLLNKFLLHSSYKELLPRFQAVFCKNYFDAKNSDATFMGQFLKEVKKYSNDKQAAISGLENVVRRAAQTIAWAHEEFQMSFEGAHFFLEDFERYRSRRSGLEGELQTLEGKLKTFIGTALYEQPFFPINHHGYASAPEYYDIETPIPKAILFFYSLQRKLKNFYRLADLMKMGEMMNAIFENFEVEKEDMEKVHNAFNAEYLKCSKQSEALFKDFGGDKVFVRGKDGELSSKNAGTATNHFGTVGQGHPSLPRHVYWTALQHIFTTLGFSSMLTQKDDGLDVAADWLDDNGITENIDYHIYNSPDVYDTIEDSFLLKRFWSECQLYLSRGIKLGPPTKMQARDVLFTFLLNDEDNACTNNSGQNTDPEEAEEVADFWMKKIYPFVEEDGIAGFMLSEGIYNDHTIEEAIHSFRLKKSST